MAKKIHRNVYQQGLIVETEEDLQMLTTAVHAGSEKVGYW